MILIFSTRNEEIWGLYSQTSTLFLPINLL